MLDTPRLRLHPFTAEQLLALIDQPERFAELTGFAAAPGLREFFVSGEVSPAWLAKLRSMSDSDAWSFGFAVVHGESGSVIGSAGFKGPPDEDGMVEIAYGIVPSFEGRGYATEAAEALCGYAIYSGLVRQLLAHTLPTPNASTRVLTKCGFQFVGDVVDPEDGPLWRWKRSVQPK